jgi:threonine/homoserine/homoserine lactone efflux protein
MAELLLAALAGLTLGVITGMPLGVINVSIVHAASHDQLRRAYGLGLGGALAGGVHAALAGIGVAPRLLSSSWAPLLAVLGGSIIAAAAISMWRQGRRAARDASPSPASPEANAETNDTENANAAGAGRGRSDSLGRGFAAGMGMTLVNAAALAAWVAVATAWPLPTRKMAGAAATGVAIGSALWFTLLARWVHRRRHHRWLRYTPRAAVVLLVGLAIVGILRGASLL